MGMPLELNTMIVTKGNEVRLEDNYFTLTKEGYRLYPLDIPVEVRRTKESEVTGMARVKRVTMEEQQTTIVYQLYTLNSTN